MSEVHDCVSEASSHQHIDEKKGKFSKPMTERDVILGFRQPIGDTLGGMVISGPGVGPAGMQPRPLELKRIMPKISRFTEDSVLKAKRFATELSSEYVLARQGAKQTDFCPFTVDIVNQRQRVVNLMCRIYVSGVNPEIREDVISAAFAPFGPIRRVEMSWDSATRNRGYAYVEYEVADSAELAITQMNNNTIAGQAIRVNRPSNGSTTTPIIENILDEAKPYPRVFVSNIHPKVQSRDLRSLFEAFGRIRSCVLLGERNPVHKSVAYIEYEEHQSANEAIVSMNMFDVGGQALRVGKAITLACHIPEDKGLPPASALAMAAINAKLQGKDKPTSKPSPSNAVAKRSKEDILLSKPPMENLISVIVSPAMVQAGLSDVAAELVGSNDVNSLITPDFYKQKQDHSHKKRVNKDKESKKLLEENVKDENIDMKDKNESVNVKETLKSDKIEEEQRSTRSHKKYDKSSRRSRSRSRSRRRRYRSRSKERHSSRRHRDRSHSKRKDHKEHRERSRSRKKSNDRNHQRKRSRSRDEDVKVTEDSTLEDATISGSNARLLVMQKLARNLDTNVILIRNLVPPEEVDEELREELKHECSRYGSIHSLVINQEKYGESTSSRATVKIFVQFNTIEDAEKAHTALNNRFFAGKSIKAEFYDKNKFESKDYSG